MRFGVGRALALAGLLVAAEAAASDRLWVNAKQERLGHQRSELTRMARRALGAGVFLTTGQAPTAEAAGRRGAAPPQPQKGGGARCGSPPGRPIPPPPARSPQTPPHP